MKHAIQKLTGILFMVFFASSIFSQENGEWKRSAIEMGLGINALGPTSKMAQHMRDHDFDQTIHNSFWGTISEYPEYFPFGPSLHVAYSYSISPKSHVGILANGSYFSVVEDANVDTIVHIGGTTYPTSERIGVGFANISILPYYTFSLDRYWDFEAGPSLNINYSSWGRSLYTWSGISRMFSTEYVEKSTTYRPGLFLEPVENYGIKEKPMERSTSNIS